MSLKNFIVCMRLRPRISTDSLVSSPIEIDYASGQIKYAKTTYFFKKVYEPNISNQTLYNELVSPRITDFLSGKNITILTYGGTGSGKTYTIGTDIYKKMDTDDKSLLDEGLLQRSIQEIFQTTKNDYKIKVSFIEIYNEKIHDLLNDGKLLDRLKDTKDGFEVDGLTEILVKDKISAINILKKGCVTRKTSTTMRNVNSSRSHAIYTITAEKCSGGYIQRSKFSIADLAGSERFDNKNELQRKEGIYINLSLSQLSTVISQLVSRLNTPAYRDSKLTSILKDSLGGNAVTVLIACLNPYTPVQEEIRSTLHFAFKASKVINTVKENLYKDTSADYETLFKNLQQENEVLKSKLESLESKNLASEQTQHEVLCSPEKQTINTIQKIQPSASYAANEFIKLIFKIKSAIEEQINSLISLNDGLVSRNPKDVNTTSELDCKFIVDSIKNLSRIVLDQLTNIEAEWLTAGRNEITSLVDFEVSLNKIKEQVNAAKSSMGSFADNETSKLINELDSLHEKKESMIKANEIISEKQNEEMDLLIKKLKEKNIFEIQIGYARYILRLEKHINAQKIKLSNLLREVKDQEKKREREQKSLLPPAKKKKISKDDSMLAAYFESSSDSEKETGEEDATYPDRR